MSRNKRPVMYKCHGGGRGGGMETGENSVQTGGRTAMQTLVTDRMCSLPLQNVCSSCTECVLFLYRMCALPVQNVFSSSTECVLFLYRMCSLPLQNVFSSCTECVLFLYRMCARRTHGDADACHWAAPWTPVVEFLYRMCSLLLQNVFSSSTECVLLGRSPGPLLWNSTCYKRCRSEI